MLSQEPSILEQIAADAEAKTENIPDDEKLGKLASLCKTLQDIEEEIERQEKQLAHLSKLRREYADTLIPQAMAEIGMNKFSLTDGTQVQCQPFYNISIKKENESLAFDWLRQNMFGDLIKNMVQVNFGSGQDQTANHLLHTLHEMGLAYSAKETVHPQTLKAWGKEQLEQGKALPSELFNSYVGQTTKLSRKG